jgi:hypothetical protein
MKCAATRVQAICRGYLYKKVYARKRRVALYQGLLRTTPQVGDHVEILMNANEPSETVYSGEVIEVQFRRHRETKIKVKYHYDGEVRKYTGKKFRLLKKECEEHKRKIGIDTKLTGRLNTARIRLMIAVTCQTRPALRAGELLEWRYHYPDGTPVE